MSGGFVDADDFGADEQALVALLGHETERFRQRQFFGKGQVERDQTFRILHSAFRIHLLPHGLGRLFAHGLAALAAVEPGEVWPEQLHVVADFRHGADGGARGLDGVPLLDGDGGRNAVDAVHLRLVHAVEELAGVGRKGFDVTALSFGIKRVKGE